jgi:hypothetical protein
MSDQLKMQLTVEMPDGQTFRLLASSDYSRKECVQVTPAIREMLTLPWASLVMEISEAVTRFHHSNTVN